MLRLAFATGTEPGKWFKRFRENTAHGGLVTAVADDALGLVLEEQADLAIARIPAHGTDPRVGEQFHQVMLYEEAPGVAVPKDSVYAEVGEDVAKQDLADEIINYRIADSGEVDVPAVRAGLQVVAANVGIVLAPRPLLKALSKKLVVPLGLQDPEISRTRIVLIWSKDKDGEAIQDFVGITKGRTANSSRQEKPKLSARQKAKAKAARREAARPTAKRPGRSRGRRR